MCNWGGGAGEHVWCGKCMTIADRRQDKFTRHGCPRDMVLRIVFVKTANDIENVCREVVVMLLSS